MINKLNIDQINELLDEASAYQENNPHERKGQAFFNVLYKKYPKIANKIRGSKYDPFHVDAKLKDCIEFLQEPKEDDTPFTDEVIEDIATAALTEFWDKVNDGLFEYEATDEQKEKAHEKIVQFALNVL